jgi:cobalt/nickel transport system permease protein
MLEARTWVPAWIASAGTLAFALREVRKRLSDGTIVMMAVLSALIFALQMLNFPVAGGTSGHFAGGAAAAIILGPWPAVVIMATVVFVQALFFADGGITALGANLLTMAIVGPLVGYTVHRALSRVSASRTAALVASFIAAWAGCVSAALMAGVLLWLSGSVPLGPGLAAMGFWHALIGLGEGTITAGLVGYLLAVRPDLLDARDSRPHDARSVRATAIGLGVIALVVASVSFVASSNPDGLEFVTGSLGVIAEGTAPDAAAMPGYLMPGVSNERLAGILAGVVGVIVTGALGYATLAPLRDRRARGADREAG